MTLHAVGVVIVGGGAADAPSGFPHVITIVVAQHLATRSWALGRANLL